MDAAIVVPCYNEETRLPAAEFAGFIDKYPEILFIFVNDGSRDGTGDLLKNLCTGRKNAETFDLEKNSGKAEAVRRGMLMASKASAPVIGFYDADMATSPEDMIRMLEKMDTSMLYVSGCRLVRLGTRIKRKLFRHLPGRVFATAASVLLDLPVYDTQCGAKFYAAECVPELFREKFVTRWFFDVEILHRMIRKYGKQRVMDSSLEYPLDCWIDKGDSKINFFTALFDFIRLIFLGRP